MPHYWLRGFEVYGTLPSPTRERELTLGSRYDTVEANTVAHRASAPYKTFRAAVAEEKLLDRPSDLRYWRPTGIGFLARPGTTSKMRGGPQPEGQYAVVHEFTPRAGAKTEILAGLRKVADLAGGYDSAVSFLVLDRGEGEEDEGLCVFTLFESKSEAEAFEAKTDESWTRVVETSEWRRRTTWVASGVGFIGRAVLRSEY